MKNVTITVDERTLEWARIEAAKGNTSVSRLVGAMLAEKMRRDDAYEQAYQEWRNAPRTWCSDGAPYPKRDEIYERGSR